MLKAIFLLLFTGVFYSTTAMAQEVDKKSKGQNIVSPDSIQSKESLKTVKSQPNSIEKSKKPSQVQSKDKTVNSEYPKKLSSGTKRAETNDNNNSLSKSERVKQIDNHLTNIEIKKETVLSNQTEENKVEVENWLKDMEVIKEKLTEEKEQLLKEISKEK